MVLESTDAGRIEPWLHRNAIILTNEVFGPILLYLLPNPKRQRSSKPALFMLGQ